MGEQSVKNIARPVRAYGGGSRPSEREKFQNPLPFALITAAAGPAGPRCGSTQNSTTCGDANLENGTDIHIIQLLDQPSRRSSASGSPVIFMRGIGNRRGFESVSLQRRVSCEPVEIDKRAQCQPSIFRPLSFSASSRET
jgi:hypothetical protein